MRERKDILLIYDLIFAMFSLFLLSFLLLSFLLVLWFSISLSLVSSSPSLYVVPS